MKKSLIMLVIICLNNDCIIACEQINILSDNDFYKSGSKYCNPFPYRIDLKCNNVKYNWDGSSIIAYTSKNTKLQDYNNFINALPDVIYNFKKNFHKNSKQYFKYLIQKQYDNIIKEDTSLIDNSKIIDTYNNPFDKNPFRFKIHDEIFTWKDSKIIMNQYNSKYRNQLRNVLIDFNDIFQYFIYLLGQRVTINSYKIDIKYNKIINYYDEYQSMTFNTPINNPFSNIIVIKDCIRTYKWHEDTIEILCPNWLNDNLSRNKYNAFLRLLETATKNFNKRYKINKELEDFEYFINQEFGHNIIVYAINLNSLGWENISNINTNKPCISMITNPNTGFVEVEKMNASYDFDNDTDDF
ncbi:MAG: hypothetical protein IJ848_03485 [Alphaproteobacteria bacterium]|nr:hypothetical protein [Alphaproteobacteria bacterium]